MFTSFNAKFLLSIKITDIKIKISPDLTFYSDIYRLFKKFLMIEYSLVFCTFSSVNVNVIYFNTKYWKISDALKVIK